MEHSKLPWEADEWESGYINGHLHYRIEIHDRVPDEGYGGTGVAICLLPKENDTPKDRATVEANARFIVTACNCHEALVSALERVKRDCIDEYGERVRPTLDTMIEVDDALKKAGAL